MRLGGVDGVRTYFPSSTRSSLPGSLFGRVQSLQPPFFNPLLKISDLPFDQILLCEQFSARRTKCENLLVNSGFTTLLRCLKRPYQSVAVPCALNDIQLSGLYLVNLLIGLQSCTIERPSNRNRYDSSRERETPNILRRWHVAQSIAIRRLPFVKYTHRCGLISISETKVLRTYSAV